VTRESKREVVVVTGASAGVGRAVVREFAAHGARLGLIARGADGLAAARDEAVELGAEAEVCPLDVSDADAIEAAATRIEERFGPIDVWINNAMVSVFSPVSQMRADEYRRVTEVNYLGYVNGTLAALRRMLPRDRGVIVQVGSALAYRGIPLQSAYCASKHAIEGFNESLRAELLHDRSRVRVVEVNLPGLNTPQFGWVKTRLAGQPRPVPPVYAPEVAAQHIYKAAHGGASNVYVGLPTLLTMVGNRVLPLLLDRYLAKTGFDAQQTQRAVPSSRIDNLWQPLPGDAGAHGSFGDESKSRAIAITGTPLSLAPPLLAAVSGFVAGALLRSARPRHSQKKRPSSPP
jgi:short-subunit dehydrogenase